MCKTGALIEEIQELMKIHCSQIANEHHKHSDGSWLIEFDAYLNRVSVVHAGYIWEHDESRHFRNLESALRAFADVLNKKISDGRPSTENKDEAIL
jgi:hypothetical protein